MRWRDASGRAAGINPAVLLPAVPFLHDGPKRRDVRWPGATAAADHAHTSFKQLRQAGGHLLRRVGVDPLAADLFRRAGVGAGKEWQVGHLAIATNDLDDVVHADVA